MRPLLIILVCCAMLMLVYRLAYHNPTPASTTVAADDADVEIYLQPANPPQWVQDPPDGEIPGGPADIEISHEVRVDGAHTRLHVFLRETHGWWVDRIYITFWYQDVDVETGELTSYKLTNEFIPAAIEFGETLEHSFVIYETDLPLGMPKGTTENWGVEILRWDPERVRSPL